MCVCVHAFVCVCVHVCICLCACVGLINLKLEYILVYVNSKDKLDIGHCLNKFKVKVRL